MRDLAAAAPRALLDELRAATPARVLVGRAGPAYPTQTQLGLRLDHAAACDAVQAELEMTEAFTCEFIDAWRLFQVQTQAESKFEFLMRPDLGRRLSPAAREEIARACQPEVDCQIVIGDGLSATAVAAQVPLLLPRVAEEAQRRGWRLGQPFVIRYCRVGIINEMGELLRPKVVILLIGERPGLAAADSLSAYMAYQPRPGHTDAQRNLISNIHARGVNPEQAAARIAALAEKMRQLRESGVAVKEDVIAVEELGLSQ